MPCFSEQATVAAITQAMLALDVVGQLVIVDDCSTDRTSEELAKLTDPRVQILTHANNQGKGAARRTGFAAARLPYVIVQDADLEYDPSDYAMVLRPLLTGRADVVYGSRFKGGIT